MLHIHSKVADMLAGLETSLSDQLDKLFMPVRRWGRELQISAYAGSSNEGVESANNANVPSYNTDTEEGAPDKKVVISLKGITKVFGPKPNAAIELMERG